jgi:nucleotide-binding universal stress UspA family protein
LQYAISLAQSFHSFLTVVYVESPGEYGIELESGFAQMQESYRLLSLDLEGVANRLNRIRINNRVLHQAGAVADVLVQLAAEHRIDLLLLGAYGHRLIDCPRLGSTAEFILRSMPCAVLTVGAGALLPHFGKPGLRTLLYASSLPEKLGKASAFIRTLASASSAHVEIIHAIESPSEHYDGRTPAELRCAANALESYLREADVGVSQTLSHGVQEQMIAERARTIRADLILFGIEHPPSDPGMAGVISTTIQSAPCPVLTVPGPA